MPASLSFLILHQAKAGGEPRAAVAQLTVTFFG